MDEGGREQPERQVGHIEFRGPSATHGYFHNPAQTQRLVHDGWLDTGDLGYLADGELFVTRRAKELIIRAGRHIHPYELEEALDGLWAANGVNRDPAGGRTAPSVLALHEIDVYAVLAPGLYRYDPRRHCLELAIASDLRGLPGDQDFVGDAPLDLVYVADLSRMHDVAPSQREPFASASAGAIVQNVYLFSAAAGLAVAARGWLNRSSLGAEMRLPRDSVPVLAQTVGHFDSSGDADDNG